MKHKPVTVEPIYFATIHYDVDRTEHVEKVQDYAFKLESERGTFQVETCRGGPAHSPYVQISGMAREPVQKAANNVASYIRRFKGAEVEP